MELLWWLRPGKESACNGGWRRLELNPWSGRSSGEGNSYPLQFSCLANSMDREAWQTTVHGVAKSPHTTEGLTLIFLHIKHGRSCFVLNLCCHLILLLSSSISTKLWGFQFIYLVSISSCSELLEEIGI